MEFFEGYPELILLTHSVECVTGCSSVYYIMTLEKFYRTAAIN
jgi:hypothetical protein